MRPTVTHPNPPKGWPKELIVPSPEDFVHNTYLGTRRRGPARWGDENTTLQYRHDCRTTACFLGWATIAFDRQLRPDTCGSGGAAKLDFLVEVEIAATGKRSGDAFRTVESLYEGWLDERPMDGKTAHRLWLEAATACGYDVGD